MLYPYDEFGDILYVTEGALDARSLQLQGLNATTTISCNVSNIQMNELKEFSGKIVISYDNDEAGVEGLARFNNLRKQKMIPNLFYCPPPEKQKDWNEAHIAGVDLKDWVSKNTVKVDDLLIYSKIHSWADSSFT